MSRTALLSPTLQRGDRVRFVSPASFPSRAWLDESVAIVESWGLVAEVGDHALDQWGYLAGTDRVRADDLNDAFRDASVRAVIATVGGAGAYRIVDAIDVAAVSRDPKPLVGFSDITHLHLALWRTCRLATIHGCLAGSHATATVQQLLMSSESLTLHRDPTALSAKIGVAGTATGPLVGGNLSAVAHEVGAGLPDLSGAILFLEDTRQIGLGRIDRQLTQLARSGALDGIAGIVLGLFTGFDDYVDRGWHLLDVLHDHLDRLGVPVLGGIAAGHGGVGTDGTPDQYAIVLGSTATISTQSQTLTCQPCVRD